MVTVADFIGAIEQLTAGSKAELKSHVQNVMFGVSLDAECEVKRALKDSGEQFSRRWFLPSHKLAASRGMHS